MICNCTVDHDSSDRCNVQIYSHLGSRGRAEPRTRVRSAPTALLGDPSSPRGSASRTPAGRLPWLSCRRAPCVLRDRSYTGTGQGARRAPRVHTWGGDDEGQGTLRCADEAGSNSPSTFCSYRHIIPCFTTLRQYLRATSSTRIPCC